jgi:phosphatidylethanolamine-binding protein (PEBP) family uncharacterized protein
VCRARFLAVAVVTLGAGALGAGCDSQDGRELPEPDVEQTTVPPSSPPVVEAGGEAVAFELISPAFESGEDLPDRFTCAAGAAAVSPPLQWTGAPEASELAIVALADGDQPLWVVTGIDPTTTGFEEGGLPESAVTNGWNPPCPGAGAAVRVSFTLHALDEPVAVAPRTPDGEARLAVEASSIGSASLEATAAG